MTRVGASKWWNFDSVSRVEFSLAIIRPVRSKPGDVPRHSSEDLDVLAPRVEDIAWGWSHRAAITSRSWQWKDNRLVLSGSAWPDGLILIEPSLFNLFLFTRLKRQQTTNCRMLVQWRITGDLIHGFVSGPTKVFFNY